MDPATAMALADALGGGSTGAAGLTDLLGLGALLLGGGNPPYRANEAASQIDLAKLLPQFANQGLAPSATGVRYIYGGGSPFPRTAGQISGGQLAGQMALISNLLDVLGSIQRARKGGK